MEVAPAGADEGIANEQKKSGKCVERGVDRRQIVNRHPNRPQNSRA
jgi:hypothetical protein